MNRVLVTGANGFIGRHVTRLLVTRGWQVRGAVRSELALLNLEEGVEGVVVGDINAGTDWTTALREVDVVVHLAARVHVLHENDQTSALASYREVNVDGTRRLLEGCIKTGVRRLVFMSSVKVCGEGNSTGAPYREDDPYAPQGPYGISKAEAEKILLDARHQIEVVILRPPMVYGPGVKANFERLVQGIVSGVPWPLGSVRNRRSMVYVGNLADAVALCLTHPRAAGEVYFVADDEALSTPELVTELANGMGKRPRLLYVPVSILDLFCRVIGKREEFRRLTGTLTVTTEKIKRELGWTPPWAMHQALELTLRSFHSDVAVRENRGWMH